MSIAKHRKTSRKARVPSSGAGSAPRADRRDESTEGALTPPSASDDDRVDESGLESFPASDPPSWIPTQL